MKNFQRQSGFTLGGLIIILGVIAVLVLTVIKVMPIYMENMSVTKSLESLEIDPELGSLSPTQIKKRLFSKLNVNQVNSVKKENVSVSKVTGVVKVVVDYEVRKNYLGNIDIVATFKDEFEVNAI